MALVECLHYSTEYPSGGQRIGDIFNLPEDLVSHYESLGWVERLPEKLGRKRIGKDTIYFNDKFPIDLSSRNMFKRKR